MNGTLYHKSCFKCTHRGCTISPSNYIAHVGEALLQASSYSADHRERESYKPYASSKEVIMPLRTKSLLLKRNTVSLGRTNSVTTSRSITYVFGFVSSKVCIIFVVCFPCYLPG